ncbi:hypothetical protein DL96DRAFT_1444572, partial [Flagelloscypha sp. PMI_526]
MSRSGLDTVLAGERFQRAGDTISKYFKEVLEAILHPNFYNCQVHFPPADSPTPDYIQKNPDYFPFFQGAVGAIDGTHINCNASAEQRQLARDRK